MKMRAAQCLKRVVTVQTEVLVLGHTVLTASQFYVIFDTELYQVDELVKAADVCFKLFFVFNIEFHRKEAIGSPYEMVTPPVFYRGNANCPHR